MPRIRTIKPEFWTSESVGRLPRDARLLFIAMWNLADDEGRLRGSLPYLAGAVFPYDMDAHAKIGEWVGLIRKEGMIRSYVAADGNSYIDIPKWAKHQKIDRPSESKIPPFVESSSNPHRVLDEASLLDQGSGNGMDQGMDQGSPAPAKPPRKPRAAPDPEMAKAIMSMCGNRDEKRMAIKLAIEKYGREAVMAKDLTGVWPNKLDSIMSNRTSQPPNQPESPADDDGPTMEQTLECAAEVEAWKKERGMA